VSACLNGQSAKKGATQARDAGIQACSPLMPARRRADAAPEGRRIKRGAGGGGIVKDGETIMSSTGPREGATEDDRWCFICNDEDKNGNYDPRKMKNKCMATDDEPNKGVCCRWSCKRFNLRRCLTVLCDKVDVYSKHCDLKAADGDDDDADDDDGDGGDDLPPDMAPARQGKRLSATEELLDIYDVRG
jgi:hypothetical protein